MITLNQLEAAPPGSYSGRLPAPANPWRDSAPPRSGGSIPSPELRETEVWVWLESGELATRLQTSLGRAHRVLAFNKFRAGCELAPPENPTCLLLDFSDPAQEFLCAWVHEAGWAGAVVILNHRLDLSRVVELVRLGVVDILAADCAEAELTRALGRAWEESRHRLHRQQCRGAVVKVVTQWTKREQEIARRILAGLLNKQIAADLGLALTTVKLYRGQMMRALGARNPAEFARLVFEVRPDLAPPPSAPGAFPRHGNC